MGQQENIATVRALFQALESFDSGAAAKLYTYDVWQTEMPNKLKPAGDQRGLAALLADIDRSKSILRSQRYFVTNMLASEEMVMVEYQWSGVVAVAVGGLEAGSKMQGYCTMVLEFRSGLIAVQRNYDSFP